jgi:hypothetical protein
VFSFPTESVVPLFLGAHGIGEIRANTVLLNRPIEGNEHYGRQLRMVLRSGANIIVLDSDPAEIARIDATELDRRRIDVWYRDDATGRLSLMLAYLTTRTADWKDSTIRLIVKGPGDAEAAAAHEAELRAMLEEVRIDASPHLVESVDHETVIGVSAESSLVLLPFWLRGEGVVAPDGGSLEEFSANLGVVAWVMAVKDLDLDAAPEEGQHEEVARALDRAEETEQVARETEKDARAAEDEIAKADDPDEAELEEVREARQAADRARREADHAKQNLDDQTPQSGPSK